MIHHPGAASRLPGNFYGYCRFCVAVFLTVLLVLLLALRACSESSGAASLAGGGAGYRFRNFR